MQKIFLVDTENVNIRSLKGANYLDENDLIILFTTSFILSDVVTTSIFLVTELYGQYFKIYHR